MPKTPELELDDIQGILLFSYVTLTRARYLHVSFDAAAKPNAWLADLAPEIAAANVRTGKHGSKVNVAFTSKGLSRLGVSRDELGTFAREWQQGMAHHLRTHVLGDVGKNDPDTWEVGGTKNDEVHALVMLFSHGDDEIEALRANIAGRVADHGGRVVHEDQAQIHDREHFGFADGIEQPHVEGSPRKKPEHFDEVKAGEFILGYENAYGEMPPSPRGKDGFDVGRNGTYLVYRKLAQDVPTFWSTMFEHADDEAEAVKHAARIVGRWPSGAPLVHYPERDVRGDDYRKDFVFTKLDPEGTRCPFGAHIRRANPRDMLEPGPAESLKAVARHRLLRRGRAYGPPPPRSHRERAKPDGVDRGLVFIALNASIRRQFEFVQQTWVNNPKFGGLYGERDPLVATKRKEPVHFSMQGDPVRCRLQGLPQFVTTRGGGYFFLPGKKAIDWLARRR